MEAAAGAVAVAPEVAGPSVVNVELELFSPPSYFCYSAVLGIDVCAT